jgi:hypothetical protein
VRLVRNVFSVVAGNSEMRKTKFTIKPRYSQKYLQDKNINNICRTTGKFSYDHCDQNCSWPCTLLLILERATRKGHLLIWNQFSGSPASLRAESTAFLRANTVATLIQSAGSPVAVRKVLCK